MEHAWHARLLDYLPLNTYVVAFPASFNRQLLMGYNVRSVFQLDAEQRLAPALRVGSGPSPAPGPDEAAEVLIETVAVLNAPDPAALRAATRAGLGAAGATGLVAPDSTPPQRLRARVPLTKLRAVAAIPTVLRVEAVPAPPVRESRPARPTSKTSRKARPRVRHR
ncbi:MAG: hypothetical protein H7330_11530 [Hymenobacteraceae bacterium]|nr:hypothetical protein [Hymenobacteraceae bacterium]